MEKQTFTLADAYRIVGAVGVIVGLFMATILMFMVDHPQPLDSAGWRFVIMSGAMGAIALITSFVLQRYEKP